MDGSDNIYLSTELVEKPNISNSPIKLAVIERYIVTPDIFEILKRIKPGKNSEIQITDALKIQARKGTVIGLNPMLRDLIAAV